MLNELVHDKTHVTELISYFLQQKNKIFIILAVLRRSVLRVARSITAAKRLDYTVPRKRRNGDSGLTGLGNQPHTSHTASDVANRNTNRLILIKQAVLILPAIQASSAVDF